MTKTLTLFATHRQASATSKGDSSTRLIILRLTLRNPQKNPTTPATPPVSPARHSTLLSSIRSSATRHRMRDPKDINPLPFKSPPVSFQQHRATNHGIPPSSIPFLIPAIVNFQLSIINSPTGHPPPPRADPISISPPAPLQPVSSPRLPLCNLICYYVLDYLFLHGSLPLPQLDSTPIRPPPCAQLSSC